MNVNCFIVLQYDIVINCAGKIMSHLYLTGPILLGKTSRNNMIKQWPHSVETCNGLTSGVT